MSSIQLPLHDYQVFCKNFILKNKKCGLFLPLGLGKTLTTLAAIKDLNPNHHVLVIAPKAITLGVWQAEIDNWNLPFRTKSLIADENNKTISKKERLARYEEVLTDKPTIYFLNRDLVKDCVDYFTCRYYTHPHKNKGTKPQQEVFEKSYSNPARRKGDYPHYCLKWPFKMVVIDEYQSFKSHSSERFKALRSVTRHTDRLVGLTGTPTPKGLEDLWSEIFLLDEGKRLGKTITSYRNTFFKPDLIVNNHPVKYTPLPGAKSEIYNRVKDIVVSMKNDHIKLPPISYKYIDVKMDDKEYKKYKEFVKEYVIDVSEYETKTFIDNNRLEDTDLEVEAPNAAVLAGKLLQMASGSIYIDDDKNYATIHKKKFEALSYILENIKGNALLAYYYQSDKKELEEYFKNLKINGKKINAKVFDGSPDMIKEWNKGTFDVMLIHPASAGFGLNLQFGGADLIWYTLPQSLEHYEQTIGRLYRQKQKRPVTIHHLITKDTIDEKVVTSLKRKSLGQKELMSAVEHTLKDAET